MHLGRALSALRCRLEGIFSSSRGSEVFEKVVRV